MYMPPGRRPIWVERSFKVSDEKVFEFVNKNYLDDKAKRRFTVIYQDPCAEAQKWCSEHQWRYLHEREIFGSEDQGVILLDTSTLSLEEISRGRNLLVIVTTRGKDE